MRGGTVGALTRPHRAAELPGIIDVDRRTLLKGGSAVAAAAALAAAGLQALGRDEPLPTPGDPDGGPTPGGGDTPTPTGDPSPTTGPTPTATPTQRPGYGPLVRTGPELRLPDGFRYVILGSAGSELSNGMLTPNRHDGMATFPGPDGTVLLVRNHEVDAGRPFGDRAYDPGAGGGTVNLVFDPSSEELVASHASLTGTVRNCAGGPTPWGTWLTCEETTVGPDGTYEQPHGYVFEVPADATSPIDPEPIRAMGRFVHEAVALDPDTGIVYLTEDRDTSGFYRFLPDTPGRLAEGGRLQMLVVSNDPQADLRGGQVVGRRLQVDWVDIADPDPADAAGDSLAVYRQGHAQGAATFARLEGCWYGAGVVYFNATTGGAANTGQVWSHTPDDGGGTLELVYESPGASVLEMPDNLTVSPGGSLLLCEDSGGTDYLRFVSPGGLIHDFAEHIEDAAEFAGACFSPDGQWLFVNTQGVGRTYAITGPWERGAL